MPALAYVADDGAAYERFLGRWTGRLAAALIDFAGLPADGPVLDVGCGTGSVAFELRRRYPGRSVCAVDASAAYLAFARRREGADSIRFERTRPTCRSAPACSTGRSRSWRSTSCPTQGRPRRRCAGSRARAECSPRRSGTFAAVWSFSALFWDTAAALDPQAALARERLFAHPLAEPQGLARLWQEIGLREIDERSLTVRMEYESFDDYWAPLLGGQAPFGSYVTGLPDDRRAVVRAAVRGAYLAGGPEGPRSLAASAWAARGRVP